MADTLIDVPISGSDPAGASSDNSHIPLSTVLSNLQIGVLVEDKRRRIVVANPEFCRLFGIPAPPEALVGMDCADAAEQSKDLFENPEAFLERIREILDAREPVLREDIYLVDGRILERDYIPLMSGEVLTGRVWQYSDVTARRRSEVATRSANDLLSALSHAQREFIRETDTHAVFDTLLDRLLELTDSEYGFIGEVLTDDEGQYLKTHAITNISWNEETRAFYEEHAPTGMEFRNLESLFGAVVTTGEPVIANEPAIDPRRGGLPEGHPPLNHFLGIPFFHGDQLVGAVGIANRPGGYDNGVISFLAPFLSTCASVIRWHHNEVRRREADEKLKQQAAELERSNLELVHFASIASHDLQEPLRKVSTFGGRLRETSDNVLDERAKDYLDRMIGATKRMQTLIQDLLGYSRVTTDARPFAPVDLNDVVRDVLADLQQRIEDVEGTVESSDLPTVQADASQMRQLIQNLVANGLKFHRAGVPPVVCISASDLPASERPAASPANQGSWFRIEVADNGIGIDPEHSERIFQIFQRLHGRAEYPGTGIGLAICRKVVERHGGVIRASNNDGVGTSFTLDLPAQPPAPEEINVVTGARGPADPTSQEAANPRTGMCPVAHEPAAGSGSQ